MFCCSRMRTEEMLEVEESGALWLLVVVVNVGQFLAVWVGSV